MAQPECVQGSNTHEHAGWIHASSWEEVLAAIKNSRVFDRDGDFVTRVDRYGSDLSATVYYVRQSTGSADDYSCDDPTYILIPETVATVSPEEMDEIRLSLRRAIGGPE